MLDVMTTGSEQRVRVLVVDDHPIVRAMVRVACDGRDELTVVGEAGDGNEALRLATDLQPDVIVLDLILPGVNGLEVAQRLALDESTARILVLTASDDKTAVFEALRLGVSGYVEKTASVDEIADAIQAVARGELVFSKELERRAQVQLGEFARKARETARALARLTPRERQVLALLAEGLSTRQIAKRLGLSDRTVESHIGNVYQKLEVRTRVQALYRAAGLGLVDLFTEPGDHPERGNQ
ncbi:MAG TPA: response regulator transcription factor [Actinomycetota bacterium]|jgi:two-component system NarL family response regulator|nr:response regulator transcription factor [Actinomycetota bacterium]